MTGSATYCLGDLAEVSELLPASVSHVNRKLSVHGCEAAAWKNSDVCETRGPAPCRNSKGYCLRKPRIISRGRGRVGRSLDNPSMKEAPLGSGQWRCGACQHPAPQDGPPSSAQLGELGIRRRRGSTTPRPSASASPGSCGY